MLVRMPRLLISVALWLLLPFAVAQAGEVELQAGMKAGLNFSNSTGADADKDQSITGVIGGGFVSINVNKWISLQPELLFSQKGSKVEGRQEFNAGEADSVIYDGTLTNRLPYVEVPVLLKLNIVNESDFTPSIYAGPSFGLRASPTQSFEGTYTDSTGTRPYESKVTLSNLIKGSDVGLVIGGSLSVESGGGLVLIDVRYTKGLNSYHVAETELELKNSVISVMIGLLF